MRKEVLEIGIIIILISIALFFVKNNYRIIEEIKKRKYTKFINIGLLSIMIIYLFFTINNVKTNVIFYKNNLDNHNKYSKYDELIRKENDFYFSIIKLNYENQNYNNPYIPKGFSHYDGEWNTGFVIEDENKNQYVWVPCTNVENDDVTVISKRYFSYNPLISKDTCYDIEYEEFLKSALENGGFYISRYEIGNQNNIAVSKQGVIVWTDITQEDAMEISKKMYDNELINCRLINGYAYDTAIQWIINTNTINQNNVEVNDFYYCGRQEYNNIYDLFDNVLELTLEKNFDTIITRGLYDSESTDAYKWLINDDEYRYSILENTSYNYIGFRTILYK